jgi:L-histidine N-alpha-methyltransferase
VGRPSNLAIDVHLNDREARRVAESDVRRGLTSTPKRLPSKYFYDGRGSRLFEQITELPEYYLTRAERALLDRHSRRVAQMTQFEELVELGSGSAKKTRLLIEAAIEQGSLRRYVPLEVSQETVEDSARRLARLYPGLEVYAVVGDFEQHLDQLPAGRRRLFAFLGSTLGNFPEEQAIAFLARLRRLMTDGDWLLLGTDLVKDKQILEAAYNDADGITAEFNRNILNVINEQVGGDFDTDAFEHVAHYNEERERIESQLRSKRDQSVRLERIDLEIEFAAGEHLRTEVSCKYTKRSLRRILTSAGMRLERWFVDDDGTFALSLSR